MAYNPSDTTYSIIKEAAEGTMPATGVLLRLENIPGTQPTYASDVLASPTLRASRAAAGAKKIGYRVEGGIDVHFKRDDAIELLLQSALSGTFVEAGTTGVAGDVLKAGNVDTSFTIEKKMLDGANAGYWRFTGCQVSKFSLDVSAADNAKASFTLLGLGKTTATTASALTYANASSNLGLTGVDLGTVSVAGLSAVDYRALTLNVEHTRETRDRFGSATPIGIGTSGPRKVTLSVTFYRKDLTPDTILSTDAPVAVSFTIGSGTNGYTFTLPAATYSLPTDSEDGSKSLITVEFTGSLDATLATDLQITRL